MHLLLLQTRLRIARVRPVTSVRRTTRNVDTPSVVRGETPFERLERDQHAQRVLQILTQNDIPIGLIAELATDDALFAADPERVGARSWGALHTSPYASSRSRHRRRRHRHRHL